jgi:hypothetical protein
MIKEIQKWKKWRIRILVISIIGMLFTAVNPSETLMAATSFLPELDFGLHKFSGGTDLPVEDNTGSGTDGHTILGYTLYTITKNIRTLLGIIAIGWITWSGTMLIISGGKEEQANKGKQGILYGALGLIFALMSETIIFDVLYGGGSSVPVGEVFESTENMRNSIDAGTRLLLDALSWTKGIIIIVAIFFLILSGAKMIAVLGNEDEINKNRSVFLWIGVGIVTILLNDVIIQQVLYPWILGDDLKVTYSPNATPGISEIMGVTKYFLKFLALIDFSAFIYGGAKMVGGFGNDDQIESGKKIITGAVIGIIIILMSFVVVSTFISGTVN